MPRVEGRKKVLVIVGMPGAGKSLASKVAKKMRMPVFVSGDVIRNEAVKRGVSPNKKNLGQLMLQIRNTEGMGAVARRLIPLIKKARSGTVVYEGARSPEEIAELRKPFDVTVISVHASPETRFRRLLKRKRGDRPRTLTDFRERDNRELRVGVGKVISLSDRMVENEESILDLRRRMSRVLKTLSWDLLV